MADTQCFFSWLVDGLASYMQQQISGLEQADQWQQHNVFSWYDQLRQHNATSSGCDGLIDGRDTMLLCSAGRRFG
jgi:hypothetical protein